MTVEHAPAADESTPVTICGRTYHLRGAADGAYLARLAGLVDAKMREVQEATGTADTLKLAILACLNLADENAQVRQGGASGMDPEEERRLARMIDVLGDALAE
jgi:cell division protein ZapA (FtsZ GTPase activity inhibitor)